jgi:hypothetical protein
VTIKSDPEQPEPQTKIHEMEESLRNDPVEELGTYLLCSGFPTFIQLGFIFSITLWRTRKVTYRN